MSTAKTEQKHTFESWNTPYVSSQVVGYREIIGSILEEMYILLGLHCIKTEGIVLQTESYKLQGHSNFILQFRLSPLEGSSTHINLCLVNISMMAIIKRRNKPESMPGCEIETALMAT